MFHFPDGSIGPARQFQHGGQVYPRSFLRQRPNETPEDYATRLAGIGISLDVVSVWSTTTKGHRFIAAGSAVPDGYTDLEPSGQFDVWDGAAWTQDSEAMGRVVRAERDNRLRACDAQALPDYPHPDEATRQAWLDYRQALRDLPALAGFPWGGDVNAVSWPTSPASS